MMSKNEAYIDTINSYMEAMDEAGGDVKILMENLYNSSDVHDLICNMASNGIRFTKSKPSLGCEDVVIPERNIVPCRNLTKPHEQSTTFQVGDVVKVKKPDNISYDFEYESKLDPGMEISWVKEMDSLQNWHCVIQEIDEDCGYTLSVDDAFWFLPEWIELVCKKEERPSYKEGVSLLY